MGCGKKDHICRVSKCQFRCFATLKIREAQNRRDEGFVANEDPQKCDGYFRPYSKHYKGKGAW